MQKSLSLFLFLFINFHDSDASGNITIDHSHHASMRALINPEDISHTAINDGSWFDPQTWESQAIPNDDAWVLIPQGLTVSYDQISSVSLQSIKVDGTLHFSSDVSSSIRLDTLFIETTGSLIIGSKGNPIKNGVNVTINIIDYGDIDIIRDPQLLSRGIVALGPVRIFGAEKTSHLKVLNDPSAGDTQLAMVNAPLNWSIGDTIVIAGTRYSGWKWDNDIQDVRYHGTQDEVVNITNIQDNIISINQALLYDHHTPRADLKTSVANFSRNVTIQTENSDTVATHRRGHVMFMHHADVDVRYAAFHQLGRTDKSVPSFEVADIADLNPQSNARGRYPFHFHRSGIEDPKNPGIGIGNAVFGSPGWGYTHHDSNAVLHNNVSFDTFGAGFVAETGNEIGVWSNNLAIKAEGNEAFNPKNGNDREAFDMGRTGDGFWFQGRMVKSINNIAASVNHGYVYLHRGSGMLSFPRSAFMLPEALRMDRDSSPDDAPILSFHGNESFASTVGIFVVKANPNQQHDVHSHFTDFTAWEVRAGSAMEYTSHYLLKNFDIIGLTAEPFRSPAFGIQFGTNTSDMVINGAHIENMGVGIDLGKNFTAPAPPPSANQYVVIDATFDDVTEHFEEYDPNIDVIISGSDLNEGQFNVLINNGDPFEYLNPATSAGSGVNYLGFKTDNIGTTPIPAGTDSIGTPSYDMIAICEQNGYYRTSDGTPYAIVEEYFTERATGKIHKFGLKTLLGPDVDDAINNQFTAWGDSHQAGIIDINSLAPTPTDDSVIANFESDSIISVLTNDTDPEGDTLSIDGIIQPLNGQAFDNLDGTILYRPNFDFLGVDTFSYWATDSNGNFSEALVTVSVINDVIFIATFE